MSKTNWLTGADFQHVPLSRIFHRSRWDCRELLLMNMTDACSASLSGSLYQFSNCAVACKLEPPVIVLIITWILTNQCCRYICSCAPSHFWRHEISAASAKWHTQCSRFRNFFQSLCAIVTKNNCKHHASCPLNLLMRASTKNLHPDTHCLLKWMRCHLLCWRLMMN